VSGAVLRSYQVAWWNPENLFDEENAVVGRRTDKVFRAIKNDIASWPCFESANLHGQISATPT
jgi:hypothetical protein